MRVLLLLLVAALTASSCGQQEEPAAAPPAAPTSGTSPQPVELGTDGGFQYRLSIAPDGRSALFSHGEGFFPQTRDSTIYEVQREGQGWGAPVEVPFVGPDSADIDPVHSPDGSRVWFSSIRPVDGVTRTDVDVWFVDRAADGGWGAPQHAGGVNSVADDLYPSIGPDGSLYLGSDRSGSGFDLYRARALSNGGYAAAEALPEPLNSPSWEFNPTFTSDGRWLVFTAQSRPDGSGAGDLFAAPASGDGWGAPRPIEEVNTAADEYHPSFSPDGDVMHFVRGGRLLQLPVPRQLSG